ncbi:MAG TPA: sugar-binding protein [Marinagarivorans sp.]
MPHTASADTEQYNTVMNFKELMVQQPVFDVTGYDLPWYFHKPLQADGNPEAKFPLVIYLHGLGESGGDYGDLWNNRHTTNFFASSNSLLTGAYQEKFPAYIVAPHCDCSQGSSEWTNDARRNWAFSETNMSRPEHALNELVDHIVENYQVDPARIYVTGISMGGAGSWGLALRRPDLIAAAVPLSGHTPDRSTMQSLLDTKLPVWAHHAPSDENNPYDETKSDVDTLAEDGACTYITSYPTVQDVGWEAVDPGDAEGGQINGNDLNHTVWPRAYTNPDLWPWVFSIAQPLIMQEVSASSNAAASSEGIDGSSSSEPPEDLGGQVTGLDFASDDLAACVAEAGSAYIDELTALNCRQQITDWSGIENLTALETLVLSGGYFNEPVALSDLGSVTELVVDGANYQALDISAAFNLRRLSVMNAGRLSELDASGLTALETLVLASNEVELINLQNTPKLAQLDVSGSDISCNALTELAYIKPELTIEHDLPGCDLTPPSGDNHNVAKRATVAPVIDGEVDEVWEIAEWVLLDKAWTGFEGLTEPSSEEDFSGRYKALWDEDYLYLLFEITDDIKSVTGAYYQQDTVELFIDEDRSGGDHLYNNNAFAYHISIEKNVEDLGDVEGHITVEINETLAPHYTWEIRVAIYGNYGNGAGSMEEARRKLYAGKIMGFTPSYIDNDGNGGREHFMSAVFTEGHNDNQGYINADSFGSLMLIE